MFGRMLRRAVLAALGGMAMAAGTVHAQPGNFAGQLPQAARDSLGLADDAAPIPFRRLFGMEECDIYGDSIVRDSVALRRVLMYPQCADTEFPELDGRTLLSLMVIGDCHAAYHLDAFRSESRREFRIRVITRYGGCRAGLSASPWLELPPLPEGWVVRITDGWLDRMEVDSTGWGWTPIRAG